MDKIDNWDDSLTKNMDNKPNGAAGDSENQLSANVCIIESRNQIT